MSHLRVVAPHGRSASVDHHATPGWTGRTVEEFLERLPAPHSDVHELAVRNIDAARILKLVRTLPAPERHVITWLYGLRGPALTREEIATRLGISVRNAAAVERRALERLSQRDDGADAA